MKNQPKKVAQILPKYQNLLENRIAGSEYSYRSLWVSVNFATVKDGHIKEIGARAFGVFMVIRAFAGKDDKAFPSLCTIANLAGCSVGTINKEINILIKMSWIRKVGRVRKENGRLGNTIYKILEKDLIRGSGQKGFMNEPLTKCVNGDEQG